MKKAAILFLFYIIIPTTLFASSDTSYLNDQLKKTSASKAFYKRVSQPLPNTSNYLITDYDKGNKLYMKAESIGPHGNSLNGTCIYYYKNGMKQSEGQYSYNNQYGIWKYWTPDHKDTIVARFEVNGKQTIISNTIAARMDSISKSKRPITSDTSLSPAKNHDEVDAEFPGGNAAYNKFFSSNLRYPKEALARSISGKAIIYFEVDKEGNVCNIIPFTLLGFGLEEEAIRVIEAMPKWIPATQGGKKVRVRRTAPVAFKLPIY